MRTTLLYVLIFLLNVGVNGQPESNLETVVAEGGDGQNIHWQKIKDAIDPDDELGFFYNDCAQGVTPIRASSTLLTQGSKNYEVANLNDFDPMTAWVEGDDGYGIGESFEIKSVHVNTIYNGYQSSPTNWKNNSRVKKFKVYQNDIPICFLVLTDEMGAQRFDLPIVTDWQTESIFKFEIVEVYPGLKWKDVAISEVDLVLCCFAENTLINGTKDLFTIEDLKKEDTIYTVNIVTGLLEKTKVLKTTSQIHVTLFKISTANHSISITEDHPIYTKEHGFVSLSRLKNILHANNYSELIDKVEFLVWDTDNQTSQYEKLVTIEMNQGKFKTYSILELENGTTFIANGFVTKTYK